MTLSCSTEYSPHLQQCLTDRKGISKCLLNIWIKKYNAGALGHFQPSLLSPQSSRVSVIPGQAYLWKVTGFSKFCVLSLIEIVSLQAGVKIVPGISMHESFEGHQFPDTQLVFVLSQDWSAQGGLPRGVHRGSSPTWRKVDPSHPISY